MEKMGSSPPLSPPSSAPQKKNVEDEVYGFIVCYEDGSVFRPPFPGGHLPASPTEFVRGVASKDVTIHQERGIWARLFLPETVSLSQKKVPLVLHFHGGGLCTGSASAASFHKFCCKMARDSQSLWISVNYRLAPEHRLPAAYDDAFAAFQWLHTQALLSGSSKLLARSSYVDKQTSLSRSDGDDYHHLHSPPSIDVDRDSSLSRNCGEIQGSLLSSDGGHQLPPGHGVQTSPVDPWLLLADFSNCFLAGESSGAAIIHYLTMRILQEEEKTPSTGLERRSLWDPIQIQGLLLLHPAFLIDAALGPFFFHKSAEKRPNTYRRLSLPIGSNLDHPLLNPVHPQAPSIEKGVSIPPCFIAVADQDGLSPAGVFYAKALQRFGHHADLYISEGQEHCFYLTYTRAKEAERLFKHLIKFIHHHCLPSQSQSLL